MNADAIFLQNRYDLCLSASAEAGSLADRSRHMIVGRSIDLTRREDTTERVASCVLESASCHGFARLTVTRSRARPLYECVCVLIFVEIM